MIDWAKEAALYSIKAGNSVKHMAYGATAFKIVQVEGEKVTIAAGKSTFSKTVQYLVRCIDRGQVYVLEG